MPERRCLDLSACHSLPPLTVAPMFTGLVETMGTLEEAISRPPGMRLVIDAGIVSEGAAIGDSIAINGCCLTVVSIEENRLAFEAGEETLSRTNLGGLVVGDRVNLERALAVGDRLGGHYVTGHVDALATLTQRREDPPWARLRFTLPKGDPNLPSLSGQIAGKGSVAVDGVSLTVVDADDESFTVALIPHTLDVTTLGSRNVGDTVNLETDVLAKYVQRALHVSGHKQE